VFSQSCSDEFDFTHNDIKLDNILLRENPKLDRRNRLEAVLSDFELLKEEASVQSDGTVTLGANAGTPAYMAPERFNRGQRPTAASDMFSVGVVMLFCFAPSRIQAVTMSHHDPARVPAEVLLT
jgi:serine/threonine protein kinase